MGKKLKQRGSGGRPLTPGAGNGAAGNPGAKMAQHPLSTSTDAATKAKLADIFPLKQDCHTGDGDSAPVSVTIGAPVDDAKVSEVGNPVGVNKESRAGSKSPQLGARSSLTSSQRRKLNRYKSKSLDLETPSGNGGHGHPELESSGSSSDGSGKHKNIGKPPKSPSARKKARSPLLEEQEERHVSSVQVPRINDDLTAASAEVRVNGAQLTPEKVQLLMQQTNEREAKLRVTESELDTLRRRSFDFDVKWKVHEGTLEELAVAAKRCQQLESQLSVAESRTSELESLRHTKNDLQSKLQSITSDRDQLRNKNFQLEEQVTRIMANASDIALMQRTNCDLQGQLENVSSLTSENGLLKRQVKEMENEFIHLKSSSAVLERKLAESEAQLSVNVSMVPEMQALRQQLQETESKLQLQNGESQETGKLKSVLSEKETQWKAVLAAATEQSETLRQKNKKLEDDAAVRQQQLKELGEDNATMKSQLEDAEVETDKMGRIVGETKHEIEKLERIVAEKTDAIAGQDLERRIYNETMAAHEQRNIELAEDVRQLNATLKLVRENYKSTSTNTEDVPVQSVVITENNIPLSVGRSHSHADGKLLDLEVVPPVQPVFVTVLEHNVAQREKDVQKRIEGSAVVEQRLDSFGMPGFQSAVLVRNGESDSESVSSVGNNNHPSTNVPLMEPPTDVAANGLVENTNGKQKDKKQKEPAESAERPIDDSVAAPGRRKTFTSPNDLPPSSSDHAVSSVKLTEMTMNKEDHGSKVSHDATDILAKECLKRIISSNHQKSNVPPMAAYSFSFCLGVITAVLMVKVIRK